MTILADIPARDLRPLPYAFQRLKERNPRAFTFKRALIYQAQLLQRNRIALMSGATTPAGAEEAGGTVVDGVRQIPVLPFRYKNTPVDPFDPVALQHRLFDTSGDTMAHHYREMSYELFSVTGTVRPWVSLSREDTYYEGADFKNPQGQKEHCFGTCPNNKLGKAITEAIRQNDGAVDFALYDNDGPDGKPNSGDDDGYVDFIALVQPEIGGECGENQNIWSHRYSLSDLQGTDVATKDASAAGGKIKIDDYVIMPALNCDGHSMIDIGVFSHEFGHAFGLPDLYDTDSRNGVSQGDGIWCLMAAGSWGGDGNTPRRPVHMNAWSKLFLGWLQPRLASSSSADVTLAPVQSARNAALKIPVSASVYYLVEYRTKRGFDSDLPKEGLLVWRINDTAVKAGMPSNRVNADSSNEGVHLVQADGLGQLQKAPTPNGGGNRGDAGDPFPGSTGKTHVDSTTTPTITGLSLCGMSVSSNGAKFKVMPGVAKCE